jgi:hypothetical protein
VIVGQTQNNERRQLGSSSGFARLHKLLEFVQEFVYPQLMGILDSEVREERVKVPSQLRFGGDVARRQRHRPWPGTC